MTAVSTAVPAPPPTRRERALRSAPAAWVTALLLGGFALWLRLWNLGRVGTLVFDETYYVKDGYTLTQRGVEMAWPDEPNPAFEAGDVNSFLDSGQYVVHPPVGKWLIGLGQMALGAQDPVSWRISTAVVGALTVVMMVLITRRLLGSLLLGAIAGLLMSVDGVHLVHSRTGLLDLFLMAFILGGFGLLLIDRDRADARWRAGLPLGFRWWRLAAGVSLGLACSVKWSGLYALAVCGILTVWWDWTRRRRGGDERWLRRGFTHDAVPAFLQTVPVAAVVYAASWTGWFITPYGYFRDWAAQNGHADAPGVWQAVLSFAHYHREAYEFHVGLSTPHDYQANPLGWLLQLRPTSFYYRNYTYGEHGCAVEKCSAAITSLGNPLLWWLASLSLLLVIWAALRWRDGRAWVILAGLAGTYLPWLLYMDRTIFTFYTIVFEPFMVLALVFAFGLLIGGRSASDLRRFTGVMAVASLTCLIVLVSAFFFPVWTAEVIPYQQWQLRMWLPSWI